MSNWLFGFIELKIPVTTLFYQDTSTMSQQQFLAPQDDAASAIVTLTELLQTTPRLPYCTEMHTSVYICNFVGSVWGSLTTHSPINLKHSLLLNKASQLCNVSSRAIAPKSRPDTMLVAESCTLLLGKDKHTDLMAAYEGLNRKRVDLSGMHYGPLKCMLGYVAAGTTVQWSFIPCHADQVSLCIWRSTVCYVNLPAYVVHVTVVLSGLFTLMTMQLLCCSLCASCGSKTGFLQHLGSCELVALPCPSSQIACNHVNICSAAACQNPTIF